MLGDPRNHWFELYQKATEPYIHPTSTFKSQVFLLQNQNSPTNLYKISVKHLDW